MTTKVYSLYIFDRHCNPVYYQEWTHLHKGVTPSNTAADAHAHDANSVGSPGSESVGAGATSAFQSISSSLRSATQVLASSNSGTGAGVNAANGGASSSSRAAGTPALPNVTRSVSQPTSLPAQHRGSMRSSSTATGGRQGQAQGAISTSSPLPFDEQAKLVYGVIFSLRNMCRKLGGTDAAEAAALDAFSSYTTPTYTLTHFQTPTMYTFILLTDPLPSATGHGGAAGSTASAAGDSKSGTGSSLISGYSISSRFSAAVSSSSSSSNPNASSSASGGSGAAGTIPGTGGVSLKTVLQAIWKGPWVQHVARNALCQGLERSGGEERSAGVDNDGFREAIEKLFAQYKLSAPPSVAYSIA